LHIVLIVEADGLKGKLKKLAHGMLLAGSHHIVLRMVLLQHQPHGLDIIARIAPISPGIQVAHGQAGGHA